MHIPSTTNAESIFRVSIGTSAGLSASPGTESEDETLRVVDSELVDNMVRSTGLRDLGANIPS
jgi:hypothetical protein